MATLAPSESPQQSRPRALTSMSHASTHSYRSSRSREEKKLDLTETARDKKKLGGKADPTKAMNEAQPAAVAEFEHSNLENIRMLQHKDAEGNVIADPDRSNPTRPRMERPLDTIRAFNAAAEGTTSRRSSYQRQSSGSQIGWDSPNKRNSSYGPPNSMYSPNGRPGRGQMSNGGGYYRNSYAPRPDSFAEDGGPVQPGPPRGHPHMRYQSAPYMPNDSPTSTHSHQPSYETMNSGSDEMSKSTNPSSQNSSFDQLHQMGQRKPDNEYGNGHNPYRQNGAPMRNQYPPTAMPNGFNNGYANKLPASGPTDDYGVEFQSTGPPPPAKKFAFRSNGGDDSIPATSANGYSQPNTRMRHQDEEPKRKSWIKRTFSKKA